MTSQTEHDVDVPTAARQITEEWAVTALPRRSPSAHKWSVGGVVVVAGSPQYAGAAALCCSGAARSGAGIVSAALPRSVAHVVVGLVPESTVILLPEGDSSSTAKRGAEAIAKRLERAKALVIGPGLGDDEAASALLGALFGSRESREPIGFGARASGVARSADNAIAKSELPVVVDADALNWLAGQERWWERLQRGRCVLTPHPGEMARLTQRDVDAVLADPFAIARQFAEQWGQVILLKGTKTIVAAPDGVTRFVETHPALATAGSGDVLSGSIGALLAQGLAPADAAALAVYAGGRAAAKLASRLGTLGVVAGDLPTAIAEELATLETLGA